MRRFNQEEIDKIKELVMKDYSLNKITDILEANKSSVYYHFRKFKGRTVSPIEILSDDEETIGEFMGLFAGDGAFYRTENYHYRIYLCFNQEEENFVEELKDEVLMKLFGKYPYEYRGSQNRLSIWYISKNIYDFIKSYLTWNKDEIKTYTVGLKNRNHSNDFKRGFLRGSLDSDGYFSDETIRFATTSYNLKRDICCFLEDLGFTYSSRIRVDKRENRRDIHIITVFKESYDDFVDIINPRNRLRVKNAAAGI